MPLVLWYRNPHLKWLAGGFMILWTLVLQGISRDGGRTWFASIYLLLLPIQMAATLGGVRHVLYGGVYAVVRGGGLITRIPLGAAEVSRNGSRARIRWPERRRTLSQSVTLPAPFADRLEEAVLAARSAPAGSVPVTAADAARAVSFGLPDQTDEVPALVGALVAALSLFGLAAWLNQPLVLLPLALLALLADKAGRRRLVMLAGDQLFVLEPDAAPHVIPAAAVQEVRLGVRTTQVLTSDAAYGEIRLSPYQSNELLKALKNRLRGEAAFPPGQAHPASAEPVLRCALCGRPAVNVPAGCAVHICEVCVGRARVEAADAGHGPAGKDPKPM